MRKQLTAVVAFGCLFAAQAALADGPPIRVAPYPQPSFEPFRPPFFQGFYIGAHAGYAVGDIFAENDDAVTSGVRGGLAGVQIGYNLRYGQALLGIEGDFSWVDADTFDGAGGDTARASLEHLASVRGRAGIVFENLLLYLTAGIAWGEADFHFTNNLGNLVRFNLNETGIVFGGGAELALGSSWTVRAEFLRYDFGADRHGGIFDDPFARFDSVDVVRVGLNYTFGFRRELAPLPGPLK